VTVLVPPHVGVESSLTARPVGSVSTTATPFSGATSALGLVSVNVSCDVEPGASADGSKAIAIDGGACTVRLADAVPPAPPSVEVTLLVTLVCCPAAMAVTLTETVHEADDASIPEERLIAVPPCTAVAVPAQELLSAGDAAITSPGGSWSVNPTPWSATVVLLFWIVNVSDVDACTGIDAAPNASLIWGGPTTVITAVFEALPGPLSVDVMLPVVLFLMPAVVPVSVTEIPQSLAITCRPSG
jgi:hypothetical protein